MKNRAIELKLDLDENLPKINGSIRQLEQVSINMISNAIDAINESGEIKISSFKNNNEIVVKWSNSGPPIPEDIKKTIFNPFFTTKEEGKGTGLGLSISYGIVQEHKGKLILESNQDSTVFIMAIPIAL